MQISLRAMEVADIAAGLRLCRLSGWNQVEADWRAFLDTPAGGGWVAEKAGAIVGTVTFLRYETGVAWLAMMLVDPACRRAGVGSQLLGRALESLAGQASVGLDASRAGEPLYRRHGFVAECELERMSLRVPGASAADPTGGSRRPPRADSGGTLRRMRADDLAAVFDWDGEVFGARRESLLASFHRRAPHLAWTLWDSGRLAGYALGRPGHRYWQLGPVRARDEAAARRLLAGCLAGETGRAVAVDVPAGKREWVAWLQAAGFGRERPFLRMRRGRPAAPPRPGDRVPASEFAVAGPEFG